MRLSSRTRGLTLVETMISTGIFGVVGLMLYSMLNVGTILGAKNSAVNVAHQNARTAMLQMTADFHAAVSSLTLVDKTDTPLPAGVDAQGEAVPNLGPAAGISFQLFSGGPYRIVQSAAVNTRFVTLKVNAAANPRPAVEQILVIRSHAIEEKITAVADTGTAGVYTLTLENPIKTAITYVPDDYVTGILTDRCSYIIVPSPVQPATGFSGSLQWKGPNYRTRFAVLGNDITSEKPFTTPERPAGAPNERVVAAIDLSTADSHYSNRGFKSANILLSGEIPSRARLTDK